jgi:hypothetical protein
MKGPLGYGRYKDEPGLVGCPRAKSDMTPCIARNGSLALADDGMCVSCGADPLALLTELRHAVTGKSASPMTIPGQADQLAQEVRAATEPPKEAP